MVILADCQIATIIDYIPVADPASSSARIYRSWPDIRSAIAFLQASRAFSVSWSRRYVFARWRAYCRVSENLHRLGRQVITTRQNLFESLVRVKKSDSKYNIVVTDIAIAILTSSVFIVTVAFCCHLVLLLSFNTTASAARHFHG